MTFTTDPAVLDWMIALAPRPRPVPLGHHWWRELVWDAWFHADQAWLLQRETGDNMRMEDDEYASLHPRPTLKGFMLSLATGETDPSTVYR
jgi:hypothetical protein